jgi:predicted GTPase
MKKFVSVQFQDNPFKSYQFLTDIEGLQQGDLVVVDTRNGFAIAQIEGYEEIEKPGLKELKWVVQKVDLTAHQERMEKQRRLNALKRKMESRKKQLEEFQIFALLAKEDEVMKEMLEEFLELSK